MEAWATQQLRIIGVHAAHSLRGPVASLIRKLRRTTHAKRETHRNDEANT